MKGSVHAAWEDELCLQVKTVSHSSTFRVLAGAPGPAVLRMMSPVVPVTMSAVSLCKIPGQSGQPSE